MITITNLAVNFGPKILFTDVNLNLTTNNRYGIVGANGCGKSTFLKVIAGAEESSFGEVSVTKHSQIGWLKQDQFYYENTAIINTVIAGKNELWQAMKEKEEIIAKDIFDEEAGYRLGELEQVIFDNDGYTAEAVAAELLVGLGIKEEYHYQPLSVLSGGYKLRVLLAQSLFENPDILLLDEPTNHLDIVTIYWLEQYLRQKFKGVLVYISHDLTFLNNLATHILDIDYGEIRLYVGNYDRFVQEKQQLMESKLQERNYLENKIAHMKVFVERFRASATRSKQSASRQKLIDKMELPNIEKSSRIAPNFNFKPKRPSGKVVVKANDIAKKFAEKNVLNKVNFTVTKGEKIIIIGPNGTGKSTLLKIILGRLSADNGAYEWGYETHISYFAQDHHELLNESITVLDWLGKFVDHENSGKIRNTLGNVLFRQDEVYKNILNLSGGEGARLLLGKIMLEESNVLVLDEPTNHLDIEAKEALKQALINYDGTLIMVSHDRDFASNIANRVIALSPKGIMDFKGTYEDYFNKYGQDYFNK
ncbi:ABC-F family ATP-binding cassette domain-containing protein [Rickettsiales endosymbiont of Stachyamoeba lipophora]|uniref:ABC-F family ATP-binding cassette domain-containing protein n=1 Tax=Rickettsiales endosymbiont of Stachyamoeba lipophora TaxID=2486578 RepID=UPI000F656033|nr:ATP-binding cassette domain-containing protein [Rickettsiales endosymbiont of Stachyamoeba lipophora]AZL15683.1 ATP-binding cassette domain-containing protein [Rickettsiales endosymbiont of Stachyamoeba lipophora]